MTADSEPATYILRIQTDDLEKQLYGRRILYVSIKRDWIKSTKVLFVRKTAFIGSGIIDKFTSVDKLGEHEKKLCLENNCYGKIEFAKLMRFYPTVAVENTPVRAQNPLRLHGASLARSHVLEIERLPRARLIIS